MLLLAGSRLLRPPRPHPEDYTRFKLANFAFIHILTALCGGMTVDVEGGNWARDFFSRGGGRAFQVPDAANIFDTKRLRKCQREEFVFGSCAFPLITNSAFMRSTFHSSMMMMMMMRRDLRDFFHRVFGRSKIFVLCCFERKPAVPIVRV